MTACHSDYEEAFCSILSRPSFSAALLKLLINHHTFDMYPAFPCARVHASASERRTFLKCARRSCCVAKSDSGAHDESDGTRRLTNQQPSTSRLSRCPFHRPSW